ncbi:MAG TPA: hypothetical protein VED63_12700, partial [Acidimicrobiales bacterium]|nr:hypothetical protein [Acidimicrobiales bacterium]
MRVARKTLVVASLRLAAVLGGTIVFAAAAMAFPATAGAAPVPFLKHFSTVSDVSSTIPANGDINPYGIATVPWTIGGLTGGDTLVSNFNDSGNVQGTGTTIVQISPKGQQSLFAAIDPSHLPGSCPGGVGLTTALAVLNDGYVVVGSLPVNGAGIPQAGCLIVLNSYGVPVETVAGHGINGPWDLTGSQFGGFGQLFVTNVLNGTVAAGGSTVNDGTVLRLNVWMPPNGSPPIFFDSQVIATGFPESLNSSALVIGPTGVALGANDTLYVADTLGNRIAAIPFASFRFFPLTGGGLTLSQGGSLNGPLGLTLAPNGDLIAMNSLDGNAVEITQGGIQVDTLTVDPFATPAPADGAGDLFGVEIAPGGTGLLFVDDNGAAVGGNS